MNSKNHLTKIIEGVESALSLKQSDFGIVATHYFELMKNGEVDEIDLYISLKKLEKFIETALPFVKDKIDETKLSTAYKKHHVSLQTQQGRPTWDYSNCGDVVYRDLSLTAKETAAELKEREKFLQSITIPRQLVDEETGEVVTLSPAVKRQSLNVVMRYEKD